MTISSTPKSTDPTFVKYTNEQARQYAKGRSSAYPQGLYSEILRYHDFTGGKKGRLLDLGCGTGKATRDLAPFFEEVVGLDPSPAMIDCARSQDTTAQTRSIHFEVGSAENFDVLPAIKPGTIDLLTAAMAAHWFDMESFWPKAASVLSPGGTVALWTCASGFCHPSTPNAEEVQTVLFELEYDMLGAYSVPGNIVSQQMYDTLRLPWELNPPVNVFCREDFVRREWNRNGKLEESETEFFAGEITTPEKFGQAVSTASQVTRWRAAHPDLAETKQDCVKVTISRLRHVLGGDLEFVIGYGVALLLFKKSS